MRHTAPRAGGEAQKANVAIGRMREAIFNAAESARRIPELYEAACARFPEGSMSLGDVNETHAEVIADRVDEEGAFCGDAELRTTGVQVLKDETRLTQMPRGSAAHIAAVFAVCAQRASNVDEQRRLQSIAGQWLVAGWRTSRNVWSKL